MKLTELFVMGGNIPEDVNSIVNSHDCTNGMTDSEHKAYKMGIENTLGVLKALLEQTPYVMVHTTNPDYCCELDIDEFVELCKEQERMN